MNRWARTALGLSTVAAAAWIAAGLLGYRVVDVASLARHTLVAFSALLGLLLMQTWVAVYLLTLERLMRRTRGWKAGDAAELARARRRGLLGSALAIVAASAQFTTANALYPARLDPSWHAVAGAASVVALIAALALETSALRRAGGVVAAAAE